MKNKSYSAFYEKGCTSRQRKLIKNSLVNRVHFFFGLRFSYIFWLLGFSANFFTLVRIPIAIIGFYLITFNGFENIHVRLFGLVLIIFPDTFVVLFSTDMRTYPAQATIDNESQYQVKV